MVCPPATSEAGARRPRSSANYIDSSSKLTSTNDHMVRPLDMPKNVTTSILKCTGRKEKKAKSFVAFSFKKLLRQPISQFSLEEMGYWINSFFVCTGTGRVVVVIAVLANCLVMKHV
jgi:hypothetical protein